MKSIFAALLILLAGFTLTAIGQPAAFQRNPWTTNPLPQVNRGFGITIQTNAGHKLVINVDGGALTNQLYWTNIAGLLRTIGDGAYTNFWVDTNVAAMTIGSIASIDPTNSNAFYGAGAGSNNVLTITGSVGVGSDALGNNSGAVADSLAFGELALRDNSGTLSIVTAIGQGAGGVNSSSIENSIMIGSSAMGFNTGVKRGIVAIGHQILSSSASAEGTNWVMVGTLQPMAVGGVNLGSFGIGNTFANVGTVSNRWIFGAGATNTRANSMVFGSGISNYNFRNVEYTFPADNGPVNTNMFLGNNGSGILSWTNQLSALQIVSVGTNLTNGPLTMVVPAENGLEKFYITLTTSNNVNLLRFYAGFSEYNLQAGPTSGAGAGFRINTRSPRVVQILSADALGLARMDDDEFVIPGRLKLAGTGVATAAQADVVSPITNAVILLGPPASSGLNTNGSVLQFATLNFPFVNVMGGRTLLYATNNAGTTNLVAVDTKTNQVFLTTYFFETNTAAINTLQTNSQTLSTVRASVSLTRTLTETARAEALVLRGGVFTLVAVAQAGSGVAGTDIGSLSFDLNGAEAWYITNTSSGAATASITTNIITKRMP